MIPWVNNFNSAIFEIVNIACRKLSSSDLGQCCYLASAWLIGLALPRFPVSTHEGWLPPNHGLSHPKLSSTRAKPSLAVVAVLGSGMKGRCGILGRLFSAVARNNVSVIAVAQGASELNICFAVTASRVNDVLRAVHQEFLGEAVPARAATLS
jgi:ACT domain-containing protein